MTASNSRPTLWPLLTITSCLITTAILVSKPLENRQREPHYEVAWETSGHTLQTDPKYCSAVQVADHLRMCAPFMILLGCQKCGTTSLAAWLYQHPQVEQPVPVSGKTNNHIELHYFNDRKKSSWVHYLQHWFGRVQEGGTTIAVEKTPDYLCSPVAPKNMKSKLKDVKLLVSLRDPLARAESHYHHSQRRTYRLHSPFLSAHFKLPNQT